MGFLQVALIVAVTAFLVQVIPTYFKKTLPKVGDGYAAPGWEKVAKAFRFVTSPALSLTIKIKKTMSIVWYIQKRVPEE